ncbi:major capsid protein [Peromfec virus RodF8_54]|uniref:Major capsid protein n=1 Tax=Peromfec virus RodF8_54 TaxID=2929383 RepID=A0A976N1X8_9VIRU|nr:major capsid protein [Peromfec virus RodF8_54]
MSNYVFNQVPVIKRSRSRFDLSHSVKTAGNVGTLYPFDVQEVYAGDTFKVKTACVSRLSSQFLRPVMDNLFLDIYYFYVPSRLLYDKWVNIFGENTQSAWANTEDYEVPSTNGIVLSGSVGDYMGLPVGVPLENINLLPFRAFAKIYNEWFRDENNISPMHIQTGDATVSENLASETTSLLVDWTSNNYVSVLPPKVAKLHDYFTSALPQPQKGSAVDVPISGFSDVPVVGSAPVAATSSITGDIHTSGLGFRTLGGQSFVSIREGLIDFSGNSQDSKFRVSSTPASLSVDSNLVLAPSNLWASASMNNSTMTAKTSELTGSGFTVNDLRFAFQYQKMLERDARSGTRYIEYLQSAFGVSPGDYRLQRSEFLGGRRSPISIHQVTQTTGANSDSSPLGEVGAFSLSNAASRYTKGFTEPGYVIGVFCVRQFHTYQQGVERFWNRLKRTDFYDPVFSTIGEQPVYARELYAAAPAGQVFGYNEAWADLRQRQGRITGKMRTGVENSLDVWHFGDYYSNTPTLTPGFINETPNYVDRAITVQSSVMPQFIFDFYIQNIAYRPLPTYSVPSLIDHH